MQRIFFKDTEEQQFLMDSGELQPLHHGQLQPPVAIHNPYPPDDVQQQSQFAQYHGLLDNHGVHDHDFVGDGQYQQLPDDPTHLLGPAHELARNDPDKLLRYKQYLEDAMAYQRPQANIDPALLGLDAGGGSGVGHYGQGGIQEHHHAMMPVAKEGNNAILDDEGGAMGENAHEGAFRCGKCLESFKSQRTLDNHLKEVHVGERCFWPLGGGYVCGRTFNKEEELKRHILVDHAGSNHEANEHKRYTCPWPVCNREYSYREQAMRCARAHQVLAKEAKEAALRRAQGYQG